MVPGASADVAIQGRATFQTKALSDTIRLVLLTTALAILGAMSAPDRPDERTCFQTGQPYADWMNLRSKVAIVYGIDKGLPSRIESWRSRGYRVHVMAGVSWGEYQDYLYGHFDGLNHEDEAQTDREGRAISHGGDVYYMSPGESYGKFLCVGVKRALDAGAEAIHLEEPEFWVRAGYETRFKVEWQSLYGEPWQPPHASCEAQWKASKLKYFLYRRALQQVFDFVQEHNRMSNKSVKCYVPTHSLINYAHWKIVSPESSLAQLKGCDGYIAQVWTGTARTPNVYRGVLKQRTFETALMEYAAMQNLVRSTGRRVWYLNDPIEDNPDRDWNDYRSNWENTLTASLLQPEVDHFEVMPWPERVWRGKHRRDGNSNERVGIPADYATELQVVCRALGDMDVRPIRWQAGTQGIGIAVSDSLMFQRGGPTPSDEHMGHFYGLAMPLVKRGIPAEPVQLENMPIKGYLSKTRVLVMSYNGQKPLSPEPHEAIADWVRKGGVLVFVDDDSDPFNGIPEWWRRENCLTPRDHLFKQLGIESRAGAFVVGHGLVFFSRLNPVAICESRQNEDLYLALMKNAAAKANLRWTETSSIVLRRGRYVVAAGLDESPASASPAILKGSFVNLFDPTLPVLNQVELKQGSRYLLIDLGKAKGDGVLAAGCAISHQQIDDRSFSCQAEGVAGTRGVILARLPGVPEEVRFGGIPTKEWTYDRTNRLHWVWFANSARPTPVEVRFHSEGLR